MSRHDPITGLAVTTTATAATVNAAGGGILIFLASIFIYFKMLIKGDRISKALAITGMLSPFWAWEVSGWIDWSSKYSTSANMHSSRLVFTILVVVFAPIVAHLIDCVRTETKKETSD